MPSSPSGLYKSKLFNFINRQSLGLSDHLGRVVRHLKVTAEWGTQILIYPLYLFVQASRTVRQRLRQTVEQISLPSEEISSLPLNSERPLNRVLQEIKPWLASSEFLLETQVVQTETDSSNLTRKFTIQGIASILDSCYLVLVRSNNQTVDLLSPSQQKILQKLIQVETANYWYERRFKLTQSRKTPGLISRFSTNHQNVLPPVRWFWQAMRWMQTSPVATRLNLFGESFLTVKTEYQPVGSVVKQPSNLNAEYLNGVIERATNYFYRSFQSKPLYPKTSQLINVCSASRSKGSSSLQKRTKLSRKHFSKSIVKQIKKIGQKLQRRTNQSLREETDNPFQIKTLIFAAIDNFLDNNSNPKLELKQSIKTIKYRLLAPNSDLSKTELTNDKNDDPWLSWDDIYVEETTSNLPQKSTAPPLASLQSTEAQTNSVDFFKKYLKGPLKHQNKQKLNNKVEPADMSVSKVEIKQDIKSKVSSTFSALKQAKSQDNSGKILPNWIETEAKYTGYVKHPLEDILERLDLIISWLEKLGGKLWKSLRKLIR